MTQKNKFRILHAVTTTQMGGAERMLVNYLKKLNRNSFDIYVVSLLREEGTLFKELRAININCRSLNFKFYNFFIVILRLAKQFLFFKPHIVQIYGLKTEIIVRPLAKLFGAKIISTIQGPEMQRRIGHILLRRLTSPFVDQYVSVCEHAKEKFHSREKIPLEKIEVIYNGIDLDAYDHSDLEWKWEKIFDQHRVNILLLSNIRPMKGHKHVIDSIKFLGKHKDSVHFYFSGTDNMKGDIHRYVEKTETGKYITFLDFQSNIIAFLIKADIMLLPSEWEGLPTSILEAMYVKTLVIATNVGGIPELISHNKTGIMIKHASGKDIADAIVSYLEGRIEVEKIIDAAYHKVRSKFDMNDSLKKYEKLYQKIINT